MVRLKEHRGDARCSIVNISIPYGAIKRPNGKNKFWEIYKFQFLMVRLKADLLLHVKKINKIFQFLMVRLKVYMTLI